MKNGTLIAIAAGAALLYFGLKPVSASPSTEQMQSGYQFNPTDEYNKKAAEQGYNPGNAIAVLNDQAASSTLKRTSETIARNVTYTTPDGIQRTGNIAQLGTGAKVAISVTPAIKDAQGKTAFDKLIEKNKANKTPAELARKKKV